MMITMTKSDLSPSLPWSAHYDSAKLIEINFPSVFLKDHLCLNVHRWPSPVNVCSTASQAHGVSTSDIAFYQRRPYGRCPALGPVCAIFFIHCVTDCRHHNQSFIQGQHCFLPGELWFWMLSSWRFGFFCKCEISPNNWRRWRWGPGSGRSWLSALIVHRSAYNAFWPFSLQFPCLPAIHFDVEMRWENGGKIGIMIL